MLPNHRVKILIEHRDSLHTDGMLVSFDIRRRVGNRNIPFEQFKVEVVQVYRLPSSTAREFLGYTTDVDNRYISALRLEVYVLRAHIQNERAGSVEDFCDFQQVPHDAESAPLGVWDDLMDGEQVLWGANRMALDAVDCASRLVGRRRHALRR